MKGVTLNVKGNPLYPSTKKIDFIMCFRYTPSEMLTLKRTETSILAGVSLINSQLIRLRNFETAIFVETATYFKIGLLNYYDDNN